ncbi:MAG TPA: NAD(+) diphosphatase [Casimicrobiaceae bacterium]|jgi:NAD+ diphosphatase|nr:NAD(+) diphosphatase [Casimicrobiaceae bacterium]
MLKTPAGFAPSHATPTPVSDAALAFAFAGAKLLIAGDEHTPNVPRAGELARAGVAGVRHYIGRLDGADCVALLLDENAAAPQGYALAGLRSLFLSLPEPLLGVAARAFQVIEWDRTHRFCGRCGAPTRDREDERAKQCTVCGYVAYPRVSPAMMVLVTRGRELLLARANRFQASMYSALAGFVEAGESIEDCIHREVREEVGVDVQDLRYFASQSWSFPHSLMIAFTARYAGGELVPDGSEIVDARWFDVDALPDLPSPMSIARRLIETTAERLREGGDSASVR